MDTTVATSIFGFVLGGIFMLLGALLFTDVRTGQAIIQHGCAVYDQHTGKFTFLDELDKGE